MFDDPVRIMAVWKSGCYWKWRDSRGTSYGVRDDGFTGGALATLAKRAKETGVLVEIDSHATGFGFRYVRDLRMLTREAA